MRWIPTAFVALVFASAAQAQFVHGVTQGGGGGENRIAAATFANAPGVADLGPRSALDGASEVYVIATTANSDGTACATVERFANYVSILRWQRQFCGTAPTFGAGIASDTNGDVAMVATISGQRYVAKLAGATGTTMWEVTTTAASGVHYGQSIGIDGSGDVRVLSNDGGTLKVTHLRGSDGADQGTASLDSGTKAEATSAAFDAGGNAYIGFWRYSDAATRVGRLAKVASNGTVVFDSTAAHDAPTMIVIDSDARIIAADGTVVERRDAFGATAQWVKTFYATDITTDENGHSIIVGYGDVPPNANSDMTLAQWDRNGTELWRISKAYHAFWAYEGSKVTVDPAGNALVLTRYRPFLTPGNNPPDPKFLRMEFYSSIDGRDIWGGGGDTFIPYDQVPREMRLSDGHGVYYLTQEFDRNTTNVAGVRVAREIWQPYDQVSFDVASPADDLLLRHDDGSVAMWLMESGRPTTVATLIGPGTGWTPTHIGRFDRDAGQYDILWAHPDGRTAMWLMNGTQQVGGRILFGAGTGWHVRLASDFNADLRDDILFEHDDGRTGMWLMDGTTQIGGAILIPAGTGWRAKLTGDFNGDNKKDIIFEHPTRGTGLWLMDGTRQIGGAILSTTMKAYASALVTGDSNEDLVMGDDSGHLQLWEMNGASPRTTYELRPAGSPPLSRVEMKDVNGDNLLDLVLYRQDGGVDLLLMSATYTPYGIYPLLPPGTPWTVRRVAFFDSDAEYELLLENTGDGTLAYGKWNGSALAIKPLLGAGSGWHAVAFPDHGRS